MAALIMSGATGDQGGRGRGKFASAPLECCDVRPSTPDSYEFARYALKRGEAFVLSTLLTQQCRRHHSVVMQGTLSLPHTLDSARVG